jgi:protoporphyrinogen oxidase
MAREEAKQRWIWKGEHFHALPVGLKASVRTTLFSWHDKLRILAEPFRRKGTDADESVAQLVRRRLGNSFERYAVDPFISGVYAGDPERLVTRYALPKLYNLEHTYGSFVRGAIAKMRQPKTPRDLLATKKVFSAEGGLQRLIDALGRSVGETNIVLGASNLHLQPSEQGWKVEYARPDGTACSILAQQVVTTVGAYALPQLLPFVPHALMEPITSLRYAPVVQVSVGFADVQGRRNEAFGGLVPSCENRHILGVLFPASCFEGRAPRQGDLFSVFVGGIKHPEVMEMSDAELAQMVLAELRYMLRLPANMQPNLLKIFRHRHAIPQYEVSSGARFKAIDALQSQYPGLIVGGNLRNGIGMADRIRQGATIIPQELADI